MGIFDWKHWVVLILVVLLVFGSKNLGRIGSDLGASIKGFRKAMDDTKAPDTLDPPGSDRA